MSDPAARVGTTIGRRFHIERSVAAGGMGRIYYAHDEQTGLPVALKLLAQQEARARERFLREAMVLAEIQHPGIVRYVAHGVTAGGEPYLAMEWLEGQDLAHHLKHLREQAAQAPPSESSSLPADPDATAFAAPTASKLRTQPSPNGPRPPLLPVAQVITLGSRLASAVAELHRRGIVHRDIKPANLFLSGGTIRNIKLLDFGTVRSDSVHPRMTEPGRLLGTPHYMAPEQAHMSGEIGTYTDVWAIGCVLYECLTGRKPFSGGDLLVVLTRILLENPPPVQSVCPQVPAALSDLIARTLAKSPSDRPVHAGMLADALHLLDAAAGVSNHPIADATTSDTLLSSISLTGDESRVMCMLFASRPGALDDSSDPDATAHGVSLSTTDHVDDNVLTQAVSDAGGTLRRLTNGVLLVTTPAARTPTDQATRTARAALRLRAAAPGLAMVLATGRAEGPHEMPLGEVVRHAARTLRTAVPGRVQLDALTASLLHSRFHIDRTAGGPHLESERQQEATRTLLGRATPWVGRRRELGMVIATFDGCVDEGIAQAVLVTAPAGMGKSRLRYELEQALRRRGDDITFLYGQGDPVSAGSPLTMLVPAIRRLIDIREGEALAVRRQKLRDHLAEIVPAADLARITAFLGEMLGVPFDDDDNPPLRAARKNPLLLGQLMQSAWEGWLQAECARQPVILVLEDLQWGDMPSVTYVDGALHALQGAPLMVLALARPEVHTVFPQLWSQHRMQQLSLHALSQKASQMLAREVLGPDTPAAVIDAVIERAGGNPFYLEELIRAVAEDASNQLPDTILGMVQARLDALGPEAKRILRAASIFGEIFWQDGVDALLGKRGTFHLDEWLDDLVARQVIRRQPDSRMPGEVELKFHHMLVRDGAYAMLTAEDRRLGHALAGAWLERAGEQDGLVLAEHFMRGGDPERAIPCFHRAVVQALEGNDLAAVVARAERAVQAGAQGSMLGALRGLQSVASYWLSDYAGGLRQGIEAVQLLAPGSAAWFTAAGSAIVSSARLGDYAQVDQLFARTMAAACEPGAEDEQLICLCRGTFQLIFHGRFAQVDQILPHITELAGRAEALNALTAAQVSHVQGLRAAHQGDVGWVLHHLENAVSSFETAGDMRNAALERTTVAWCWAELGFFEQAAVLGERNLAVCQQIRAQQAITYAKVNLGYILSYCPGRLDDARRLLEEAIAECHEVHNPRLEGWTRAHLTWVEHQVGDHHAELHQAATAVDLLIVSPGLQAWAMATHARALLALSRPAEALMRARAAMTLLQELGGLPQGQSLPPLVLGRALAATGDRAGARAVLADAVARVEHRAARLPHAAWREHFLAIHENRETLALALTV